MSDKMKMVSALIKPAMSLDHLNSHKGCNILKKMKKKIKKWGCGNG